MSIEFSIVICTHNREDLLPVALKSACEQSADPQTFEVVVVDNNSTDGTRDIVNRFREQFPNVQYYFEPKTGLSHARNCGWQNARGSYVAYIDDDCTLPPHWLTVARRIVNQFSPGAFGGPALPLFNEPSPPWFKESYSSRKLESGSFANSSQLRGHNMVIRRSLLADIQGFDPNLGMKGKKIAYGEETRFFERVVKEYPDETLYFDPDFFLYHLVRTEKMTLPWLMRGFFAKGRYSYLTLHENNGRQFHTSSLVLNSIKLILLIAYDLSLGALLRDRKKYNYMKNYFYEHTAHYLKSLGRLYAKHEVQRLSKTETDVPA